VTGGALTFVDWLSRKKVRQSVRGEDSHCWQTLLKSGYPKVASVPWLWPGPFLRVELDESVMTEHFAPRMLPEKAQRKVALRGMNRTLPA